MAASTDVIVSTDLDRQLVRLGLNLLRESYRRQQSKLPSGSATWKAIGVDIRAVSDLLSSFGG